MASLKDMGVCSQVLEYLAHSRKVLEGVQFEPMTEEQKQKAEERAELFVAQMHADMSTKH